MTPQVSFYQRADRTFALRALLFHQVYYLYSASAFVWVLLERMMQGLLGRAPARGV